MPRVVHFDFSAQEPESLIEFYKKVFDWQFWRFPGGSAPYWLVRTGKENEPGIDGGLRQRKNNKILLENTIGVPSLDKFMKKIEKEGGKITVPKVPIPGIGWLTYFVDPQGNTWGLMEEDKNAK